MQRASLRAALALALAVAALAAAPARAQLDDAAKTKILSDPGYASYEAKRSDERNDETGGTMTIPAKTLAARATAATAKGPQQTKAPSANVPQPAARNALRPDLKVSMSPDAPGQWP